MQALNSLNDQTFFEASQALADKMLKEGEQLEDRIKMGYYRVMGKEIEEKKLALLVQLYNEAYQHYFDNKNSDDFPEIALREKGKDKYTISALTVVANTLLNLDEVIVKG